MSYDSEIIFVYCTDMAGKSYQLGTFFRKKKKMQ